MTDKTFVKDGGACIQKVQSKTAGKTTFQHFYTRRDKRFHVVTVDNSQAAAFMNEIVKESRTGVWMRVLEETASKFGATVRCTYDPEDV